MVLHLVMIFAGLAILTIGIGLIWQGGLIHREDDDLPRAKLVSSIGAAVCCAGVALVYFAP